MSALLDPDKSKTFFTLNTKKYHDIAVLHSMGVYSLLERREFLFLFISAQTYANINKVYANIIKYKQNASKYKQI